MGTVDDLILALRDLRITTESEIRSRTRILFIGGCALAAMALFTGYLSLATYLRGAQFAAERDLQTARAECVAKVDADAQAAAYGEVDLIIAASLIRRSEALSPEERARLSLPREPGIADYEQARRRLAEAVQRLNTVTVICYGPSGPDPEPVRR